MLSTTTRGNTMNDLYCAPLLYNGRWIYGGAARNARIKQAGGLEHMIDTAAKFAALNMYQQVMGGRVNQSQHQART